MADPSQIERVLANLIANAVSATPRGGRILVAAHRTGDRVEVSVSDTGRGIPKEYLPRLFGKFIQVPGGATGSAGLGLAISRQIVQAHGGDIRAASEPGHGATFTFTLPVAGSSGGAPQGDMMNRRVLIIDDETNIRRMMRLTLEADGYDVEDAPDGSERARVVRRWIPFRCRRARPEDAGDGRHRSHAADAAPGTGRHDRDGDRLRIDRARGRCDEGRRARLPEEAADARPPQGCAARGAVETRDQPKEAARPNAADAPASTASRGRLTRGVDGQRLLHSRACHPATSLPTTSIASSCAMPAADRRARSSSPSARRKSPGSPGSAGAHFRPANPFWQQQAERALMNHMFRHAALPPGNHLAVTRLEDDAAILAREWNPG